MSSALTYRALRTYSFAFVLTPQPMNNLKLLIGDRLPLGDYDHLHILCETDDSLNQVAAEPWKPRPIAGSREKNLRDLIPAREINNCRSDIFAIEDSSFDVEITCKV